MLGAHKPDDLLTVGIERAKPRKERPVVSRRAGLPHGEEKSPVSPVTSSKPSQKGCGLPLEPPEDLSGLEPEEFLLPSRQKILTAAVYDPDSHFPDADQPEEIFIHALPEPLGTHRVRDRQHPGKLADPAHSLCRIRDHLSGLPCCLLNKSADLAHQAKDAAKCLKGLLSSVRTFNVFRGDTAPVGTAVHIPDSGKIALCQLRIHLLRKDRGDIFPAAGIKFLILADPL